MRETLPPAPNLAPGDRLLILSPHPDDETLGLGSTLARYSSEGIQTYLLCATRGERGWFDSEGPDPGLEGVARIREAELRCAEVNLGIHEVSFLDYIVGVVDQARPEEIIGKAYSTLYPPGEAADGLAERELALAATMAP